jgi:uncharacterized protein
MLNRYLTYYKTPTQFMVFCLLVSLSFLVGTFALEQIHTAWLGFTSLEINDLKEIPPSLSNKLKWTNSFMLLMLLLVPSLIFAYLSFPNPKQYLGLIKPVRTFHWLWGITLLLIAMPFTGLLEEWSRYIPALGTSKEMDQQYDKIANAMLLGTEIQDLLLNILAISLFPAIIEEIFFRGCLQQIFMNWMRKTPFTAILIVAIIFSAFHGQLSGFVPRLFLGMLLGLVYYFSGSIWISIVMHFLNNFITVVLIYLANNKSISFDVRHLPDMNWMLGICSGLFTFGFIYLFWKTRIPMIVIEVEKTDEQNL